METCSNCGATNRPGAKFCTSCGVRLPALPERNSADWTRSETPPPAQTPDPEQASESPDDATSTAWSSSSAEAGEDPRALDAESTSSDSSWSWQDREPASTADAEEPAAEQSADDKAAVPATGDDTDTSTGGPKDDASSTLSSWASQWTGEYAAAPDTDERQATADVPAAEAHPETGEPDGETAATPAEEPAAAVWSEPADEERDATEVEAPSEHLATSQSGEPSGTGTGIEPEMSAMDQEYETTGTVGGEAGAVQRAEQLLDELRALLPSLATPSTPPVVETDVPATLASGAIADELESARRDGDDFADLRRALESARDRPRDVDTMLDLVGRIDAMLAALDAHDRYAAAIDRATGQFRGESEQHAPAEPGEEDRGSFSWQSI